MLTLYQVEWCPYCHRVRQVLTELGLTYLSVAVPARREERGEVIALAGSGTVPVLQDGDRVLSDSQEIVDYLRDHYPRPEDADDHAASGAFRTLAFTSLSPVATLARLKELVAENEMVVLAETPGRRISDRLDEHYTLLHVCAPTAAALAAETDAAAPTAMTIPISVTAAAAGSAVAVTDPLALVWLFGEPPLNKVLGSLRQKVRKVVEGL